jgi:wyosine [tRNA(Phe)-imidazoG37] synthetase (radical SAM superfamily)
MPLIAFGPVPSRRLGRSLGINHIPPKVCTYSCAYCQLGRTVRMSVTRRPFYDLAVVEAAVRDQIAAARGSGEAIDYLAFVPDGEPTLDANLGRLIRALRTFEIPIAVITNGSLLGDPQVRENLSEADWVSVKMDAVREDCWRKIDRPHGSLDLDSILEGAQRFAATFTGDFLTETMLLGEVNDGEEELGATARFLEELRPEVAYLSIPTRPPAESWARAPAEGSLARAYEIFHERLPRVELLSGYEGDAFASSGDAKRDLLSITAVHPMRESAVLRTLEASGAGWNVVQELLQAGELVEVSHGSHRYYLRPVSR